MELIQTFLKGNALKEWLNAPEKRQLVLGLSASAKALAIASYYMKNPSQILLVAPNLFYANQLIEDLQQLLLPHEVWSFPVDEVLAAELAFSSSEAKAQRVATLDFLTTNKPGIVVTSVAGVKKILPEKKEWETKRFTVEVGKPFPIANVSEQLIYMGYVKESLVRKPGEFAIRGNIIDIYPLQTEYPFRIELFDTEVDSLRTFDPETQRSIDKKEVYSFLPTTERIVSKEQLVKAAEKIRKALEKYLVGVKKKEEQKKSRLYFEHLITLWEKGELTEEIASFSSFIYPKKTTLVDYFDTPTVFIDDLFRSYEVEETIEQESAQWLLQKLEENRALPEQTFYVDFRKFIKKTAAKQTIFSLFQKGMGNLRFETVHSIHVKTMQQFFGQLPLLKTEMDRFKRQNQTVVILVPTTDRIKKVEALLRQVDIAVTVSEKKILPHTIQIHLGQLTSGFELTENKLIVLTEKEIFQTITKKKQRTQHMSNAERIKSYTELKPGDFVVHVNHGIGRYMGMETLKVDGIHQDYISILYQNNDKLFIPVTQLNLIQKYVSSEAKAPKVNKLGGSEWHKTKRKVSSKIEDIADELIALYAKRESEVGFSFSKDNAYQKEFEEAFPYSETKDQLRSIQEIKQDMEKKRPMDRLLVGDVGFGKTEVALRAAFKAIQDQKQVAFLVPTTILAQQHYETILSRFEGYPVTIGLLSRFKTKKQQEETLEELKKGQIDIIIGTHRLLSKDVLFSDLGLLIVDEEQRFGVKHKERLKQLRAQVDVLTLTATPIPRTLHMSMLGVRDLSVIETPPENRYPVQTYVMEKNSGAIREGIQRELARHGQVFYLYNRVETIEQKVAEIQELVPHARIAYAHGQMSEAQLENVLFAFVEGEFDVLVTTTIIETGVNIPNVNTLFVENADYMGLSSLYQLRGRVGRTNRIAYAYLMYEPQKILNEISEKRLKAIKDFTELGSGFKIAMRDLSIRGAGNLLGSQQHGFIDAVGFDMYTQMLEDAVKTKQGNHKEEQKSNTEIDLIIDAYLPDTYIQDQRQKIEIYKRIRQFDTKETIDELQEDLIDRFSDYPKEVGRLLLIGELKMYADDAFVETIRQKGAVVYYTLSKQGTAFFLIEDIFKALKETTLQPTLATEKEKLQIKWALPKQATVESWLVQLIDFSKALSRLKKEKVH